MRDWIDTMKLRIAAKLIRSFADRPVRSLTVAKAAREIADEVQNLTRWVLA